MLVLELVGARVLAPYFGATIIIWTSLIGIILASMAAGYWWGGHLADRHPDYRYLTFILLGAGLLIGTMAYSKEIVLSAISANIQDLRLGAILGTTALFGPPSFLLAAVSPFVVRIELHQIAAAGSTVGRLSATSTAGSILGTFLVGFVLLAHFGHFKILLGLAAVVVALSGAAYLLRPSRGTRAAWILVLALLAALQTIDAPTPADVVLDLDSQYSRIAVREFEDPKTHRPVRTVRIDIYGDQGGIFLDGDDDLVLDYQKFFRISHHYHPKAHSLLVLGGGVFTYPRDFLKRTPSGRVDVVEIDPLFITLAKEKFGLVPDPRLTIYNEDARTFVGNSKDLYDVIVVDAFSAPGSVPYQLTTVEFVSSLNRHLGNDGLVIVNLISAIVGPRGDFLRSLAATYAEIFPEVKVFQLDPAIQPKILQTLFIIASQERLDPSFTNEDPEIALYLSGRWRKGFDKARILTDDFAPVDYFFAKAIY